MTISSFGRPPRLVGGWYPVWWHVRGTKIALQLGAVRDELTLGASAAKVVLSPQGELWQVAWKIRFSSDRGVDESLLMTAHELMLAFGLAPGEGDPDGQLLKEFGGSAAVKGKFIRWHEYLNIPGPGTGHDGDPNVSVELDDRIRLAVRTLLTSRGVLVP